LIACWIALVLAVPMWWFGGVWYINWYDITTPVPPLPEGSTLQARNPDDRKYWGSIARYWYYAKYSTPLPSTEVHAFYAQRRHTAIPFGGYFVDVLAPLTDTTSLTYNTRLVSGVLQILVRTT
jgi:hypothetical protein